MRFNRSVLLPLSLLGACAAPAGEPSQFSQTNWRFVSIDGETPATAEAQLTFEEERIGANVGCNGMGGPWRIEDGRLIAGPLVQTKMFCEGDVWHQEQAVGALLVGAPKVEVEGDTLVLKSSAHHAELTRAE